MAKLSTSFQAKCLRRIYMFCILVANLCPNATAAPPAHDYFVRLKEAREKRDYATMSNIVAQFEAPDAVEPLSDKARIYFTGADAFELADRANPNFQKLAYQLNLKGRKSAPEASIPKEVWYLDRFRWYPNLYSSALDDRTFSEARNEEAELLLKAWRRLDDERKRTAGIVPPLPVTGVILEMFSEAEKLENTQNAKAHSYLGDLRRNGDGFNFWAPQGLATYYSREPVDFDELLGLIHQRMGPEAVESVWTNVFKYVPAKHQPAASQAYVRYQVQGPEIRKPEAVTPVASGSSLPAFARPSKLRDRINAGSSQGVMGAVSPGAAVAGAAPVGSGGGAAGGRMIWPWAVLGVAAVAGAWVWLRQRG